MGRINSIETMGLVDGPGIRFVVFFQGCYLRCQYCHNPETWSLKAGIEILAQDLLAKALRYENFFQRSGGGITCSGGEPLLQPEFLIEFLKLCQEKSLHTALDTSGFGIGQYQQILKYTDLVILDLKHFDPLAHQKLTGHNLDELWRFKQALDLANTKLWLRHVVVPGITDTLEHILEMRKMAKKFRNVERIELLPFHNLAIKKYQKLGLEYKLAQTEPMDKEKLSELERIILN